MLVVALVCDCTTLPSSCRQLNVCVCVCFDKRATAHGSEGDADDKAEEDVTSSERERDVVAKCRTRCRSFALDFPRGIGAEH